MATQTINGWTVYSDSKGNFNQADINWAQTHAHVQEMGAYGGNIAGEAIADWAQGTSATVASQGYPGYAGGGPAGGTTAGGTEIRGGAEPLVTLPNIGVSARTEANTRGTLQEPTPLRTYPGFSSSPSLGIGARTEANTRGAFQEPTPLRLSSSPVLGVNARTEANTRGAVQGIQNTYQTGLLGSSYGFTAPNAITAAGKAQDVMSLPSEYRLHGGMYEPSRTAGMTMDEAREQARKAQQEYQKRLQIGRGTLAAAQDSVMMANRLVQDLKGRATAELLRGGQTETTTYPTEFPGVSRTFTTPTTGKFSGDISVIDTSSSYQKSLIAAKLLDQMNQALAAGDTAKVTELNKKLMDVYYGTTSTATTGGGPATSPAQTAGYGGGRPPGDRGREGAQTIFAPPGALYNKNTGSIFTDRGFYFDPDTIANDYYQGRLAMDTGQNIDAYHFTTFQAADASLTKAFVNDAIAMGLLPKNPSQSQIDAYFLKHPELSRQLVINQLEDMGYVSDGHGGMLAPSVAGLPGLPTYGGGSGDSGGWGYGGGGTGSSGRAPWVYGTVLWRI